MKISIWLNIKKFTSSLIFITLFCALILPNYAYADTNQGLGRYRTCSATGIPDGLDFDPLTSGQDSEFVLTNPICLTVILSSYIAVKAAVSIMNGVCGSGSPIPRLTPSLYMDGMDFIKATEKAGETQNPECIAAIWAFSASYAVSMAEIGVIYGIANDTYNHTEICGANWVVPNSNAYDISTARHKKEIQDWIELNKNDPSKLTFAEKNYREWYYDGVEIEDRPSDGSACLDIAASISAPYQKQKYYMRGLESGHFNCNKYDIIEGQNDPADITKKVTPERLALFRTAYNCCKYRSQNYLCINMRGTPKFCKANSNCTINSSTMNDFNDYDSSAYTGYSGADVVTVGEAAVDAAHDTAMGAYETASNIAGNLDISQRIIFSVKSVDNGRLLCAQTYSLCPYNFFVGGGSDNCNYYKDGTQDSHHNWTMISPEDLTNKNCAGKSVIRNGDCTYNSKAGKCENYCQYLVHCSKVSSSDYAYKSGLSSPYFDTACLNFVGDSRNQTSYGTGFIAGTQRHFSAPIAQCIKETLQNLFYNKIGHTKCADEAESPAMDGSCASGNYAIDTDGFSFKKGNTAYHTSFFSVIQNSLRSVVKMALTLSIVFYGMKILLGLSEIKKSEILLYIIKFSLVLYFAVGNAWQTMFFEGVYNSSSYFSELVFKINVSHDDKKRDGCQFGKLTFDDQTTQIFNTYPPGKDYLALWDTLDCKIARYLGFGTTVSVANLAKLIAAGFFTAGWGIYFSLSVMFFGFFLIATTIRALHIFLSSLMSILLMVFISPLIIPTVMFARTNNIFKGWLTNLISFCLQPMILFAYIAIFLTIMDKTLIGSATFYGPSPSRIISCSKICQETSPSSTGATTTVVSDEECDNSNQEMINPMNDSLACLVGVNQFGHFPGLEMLGLTIPILINVFDSNVKEKILTILQGVFIMYILCKFMDEIPTITSQLLGGDKLPSENFSAKNMFNKTANLLEAIQKRGARGSGKLIKKGYKALKGKVRDAGSQGSSTKEAETSSKGINDKVGSSSSGGSNDASGNSGGNKDGAGKSGGGYDP